MQTKKQPSKRELELRAIVRERVLVELNRQNKRVFLNCSELDKRITELERAEQSFEKYKKSQETIKIIRCAHDTHFDSIGCFTSRNDGRTNFLTLICKCSRCGLKFEKHSWQLTRKEKKAIRILGVKI